MAQSPSTFGYVLTWVRNKLQQVEREMAPEQSDNRITEARQGLDNLIKSKDSLSKVRTAKQDYQKLVDMIQKREIGLTPKAKDIGKQIHRRKHGNE